MNKGSYIGFSVGIVAAVFSGCASTPSNADLIRGHRSEIQVLAQAEDELKDQLAQDWDRGRKLIESGSKNLKDGEKRIESAERNLKRGKEEIEQGNRELAEGRKLIRTSERRFREAFSSELELSGDL